MNLDQTKKNRYRALIFIASYSRDAITFRNQLLILLPYLNDYTMEALESLLLKTRKKCPKIQWRISIFLENRLAIVPLFGFYPKYLNMLCQPSRFQESIAVQPKKFIDDTVAKYCLRMAEYNELKLSLNFDSVWPKRTKLKIPHPFTQLENLLVQHQQQLFNQNQQIIQNQQINQNYQINLNYQINQNEQINQNYQINQNEQTNQNYQINQNEQINHNQNIKQEMFQIITEGEDESTLSMNLDDDIWQIRDNYQDNDDSII